jgi:hypothetical protein
MNRLAFSKTAYLVVRERLRADDPWLDERILADTLEGVTDLHEVIAAIVRAAVTDEALAEGLRGGIGEMQERLSRFEERASKRRRMAPDTMAETSNSKVSARGFTVCVRVGNPAVVITDESALPRHLLGAARARLDRQKLQTDLRNGASILSANLSNSEPVLNVRTK